MSEEAVHFASFNLPPHTWYRKNEIFGTVFHIYDWESRATCSFEEGGYFVLNDYRTRTHAYTTLYRNIEDVVTILRILFLPHENMDYLCACSIDAICRGYSESTNRNRLILEKPISPLPASILEYYGYTINAETLTITW